MSTLTAAHLLFTYLRANWRHFTMLDKVSVGVDVALAALLVGSAFWVASAFSVAVALVFALYLVVTAFATVVSALDRIGQNEMTANYLAQFDGEHTLTGPAGQKARFDARDGWVEAPTERP